MRTRSARRGRRAAERGFGTLVENAPLGIVVGRDRRVLYANRTGLNYVGAAHLDAVLGSDLLAAVAVQDRAAFAERLARVGAGHDDSPAEIEVLRADGTTVAVETVAFQVELDGGPAVAVLARDVSADRDRQNRVLVADRLISIARSWPGWPTRSTTRSPTCRRTSRPRSSAYARASRTLPPCRTSARRSPRRSREPRACASSSAT